MFQPTSCGTSSGFYGLGWKILAEKSHSLHWAVDTYIPLQSCKGTVLQITLDPSSIVYLGRGFHFRGANALFPTSPFYQRSNYIDSHRALACKIDTAMISNPFLFLLQSVAVQFYSLNGGNSHPET